MVMHPRLRFIIGVAAAASVPMVGAAQASFGFTLGTAKISDVRSQRGLSAILQYQVGSWLTLSAVPAYVHVSNGTVSSTGLGDLPLEAGAAHTFAGRWSPTLGAALVATLPTGNTTCGLGTGQTSWGMNAGVGVAPSDAIRLSASGSRGLSGLGTQSALSAPQATSLAFEAAYAVAPGWILDGSVGGDVGHADSTQALARTVGAGVSYAVAGPLAFTVDVGHGLTSSSPQWVVSLGIGTAFSGVSPVAPTSSLRRLKTSVSGGISRGGGSGKIGCH
jgi:hypothetical protein